MHALQLAECLISASAGDGRQTAVAAKQETT